jgi:hypothetical protein
MCIRASGRMIERLDSDGSAFTVGAFWDRDLAANGSDGASRPVVIGNSSGQLAVAYDHNKSFMHVDAHGDDPVVALDTAAAPLGSMQAVWDASGFLISSGIQVMGVVDRVTGRMLSTVFFFFALLFTQHTGREALANPQHICCCSSGRVLLGSTGVHTLPPYSAFDI